MDNLNENANMTPRLSGQNDKFFKVPKLSLYSQKRLSGKKT